MTNVHREVEGSLIADMGVAAENSIMDYFTCVNETTQQSQISARQELTRSGGEGSGGKFTGGEGEGSEGGQTGCEGEGSEGRQTGGEGKGGEGRQTGGGGEGSEGRQAEVGGEGVGPALESLETVWQERSDIVGEEEGMSASETESLSMQREDFQ